MKNTMKFLGFIALVAVMGFAVVGCDLFGNKDDNENGDGDSTAVTFSSVTANGSSSQTTTQLTLTFNQAITGLSAADITLSGVSVTKGTLSGSGPTYTLPISGFTAGGTLNVAVAKSGYTVSGSPKTVTVYYSTTPPVNNGKKIGELTVTGLAAYDGKYAYSSSGILQVNENTGDYIFAFSSVNFASPFTASGALVNNGSVTLNILFNSSQINAPNNATGRMNFSISDTALIPSDQVSNNSFRVGTVEFTFTNGTASNGQFVPFD
jgi:hypothetical protein